MKDNSYEASLRRFLIPILRRKSLYWTARNDAIRASRRDRGFYECKSCKNLFSRKEIEADHIIPVVNLKEGWQGWDVYIHSLYCDVSNFQILCKLCHLSKTTIEQERRLMNKKKKGKKK